MLLQQEPDRYRLEEGDGTSHAQRIVRELYFRYEKQLQRWKDYRNLFFFLGFVALFLAVLYEQRQSSTAFEVYSTIDSVVTPKDDTMQDNQGIYNWLDRLLTVSYASCMPAAKQLARLGLRERVPWMCALPHASASGSRSEARLVGTHHPPQRACLPCPVRSCRPMSSRTPLIPARRTSGKTQYAVTGYVKRPSSLRRTAALVAARIAASSLTSRTSPKSRSTCTGTSAILLAPFQPQ